MIRNEYLLVFNSADGQCKSVSSFNSLLESNTDLSTSKTKIKFKNSEYGYKVELTEINDKSSSVFHVTIEAPKLTDKFRELLRVFRKTVTPHLEDEIQIIWDGVSFEWSKELYPLIYEVENSMRKLTSKFMLTKLGIGWHKSTVPKQVEKSIKSQDYTPSHGILYEVDFIQLSNFLFESYSLKDINKLPALLKDIIKNGFTEEKKTDIQDFIPMNNWDRYFSELVDCESEELKKKWEKLYEIRCKVAHNKSLSYDDNKSAKELSLSLNEIISKAISKLSKIEIPEDLKESVSLHTMATVDEPTKKYINKYLTFNDGLNELILKNDHKISGSLDRKSPLSSLIHSSENGSIVLREDLKRNLFSLENQKNIILNGYISPNQNLYKSSDMIFGKTASGLVDYLKLRKSSDDFLKLFSNQDSNDEDETDKNA